MGIYQFEPGILASPDLAFHNAGMAYVWRKGFRLSSRQPAVAYWCRTLFIPFPE